MKLSYSTGGYCRNWIKSDSDAIDYLADIGYRAVDYSFDNLASCLNDGNPLIEAKKVKETATFRGVTFAQSHAPFFTGKEDPRDMMKKLHKTVELCGYLEIPCTVIHLFKDEGMTAEETYRANSEYYSELFPLLDRYGVDLCIENTGDFISDMYCSTAEELLCAIKAMNHPRVHACWDTGHGNVTNRDQYKNIAALGSHIKAVHIHDNFYPVVKGDGMYAFDAHNFPLYGNVNFDAVIQALIDIKYAGAFSLETETPNRRGHRDFVYNGNVTLKLKPIPFWMREDADKMLYKIGRYMLQTYGLWEE